MSVLKISVGYDFRYTSVSVLFFFVRFFEPVPKEENKIEEVKDFIESKFAL